MAIETAQNSEQNQSNMPHPKPEEKNKQEY